MTTDNTQLAADIAKLSAALVLLSVAVVAARTAKSIDKAITRWF